MKSVPMSWVISALVAICVTPGFGSFARGGRAPAPAAILAQNEAPLAVPGSADAPPPAVDEDGNYQAGQAQGQMPNDADSAQQPPANAQQQPDDDGGDDASAQQQQQQQQSDDNGDEDATPPAQSSGDEN